MMDTLRPIEIGDFVGVVFATQPGPAPQLQWLAIETLVVDERYQRPLSQRGRTQIRRIAERFRWSRFAPIVVAPIEGGLYAIVDGQHRTHAAKLRGIKSVPCMVTIATEAEQAEAFVEINTRQLAVRPATLHASRLLSGDPKAVALDAVCTAAGARIRDNLAATEMDRGDTLAVACLYKLMTDYGDAVVEAALRAVVGTGDGHVGMVRAPVLLAYADVLHRSPEWVSSEQLCDVLDDFDLEAAFARMGTAPRVAGQPRWRVLAGEFEAFLDRRIRRARAA